jgi:class 3 adenylate cyclase/tetratricopeptide (TPR) repeat protein
VAERRITSVLFADLVGFTPLSESRDSEEVRDFLSRYFAECRTVIGRYGGTVEKFIGDAVMAVWGVPSAREDDAERAVRAGMELTSVMAGLGEELGIAGLSMRVGVVTGEVAVTVGATNEGMVAGDTVNTAARVQAAAEPGQVWVDDATRSLTSAAIAYEDVGEHELKGKSGPVHLHAARAVVADVGGEQRVDGLEAPLAGRDRDLRLLKELFHGAEESNRPRLVVVDGEAGIGKSRLAWEFEKYVDGLAAVIRWHRGRCLSYGDGVAFWPLVEAVRARLGLSEGDVGEVLAERLEAGLEKYVPDADERDWLRPRLGTLIGVERSGAFPQSELFVAWTTWFERVAADAASLVLVVEDAQHADAGMLDFLDHLLANAQCGIFVVALARPELLERRPGIGGRRASVIRLDPLDDKSMQQLVGGLVDGLSAQDRAAIAERSEGVPLFAVETLRALIDRDVVVPRGGRYVIAEGVELDLEVVGAPATLHALVAARIDALSSDERRVVTDASVLGMVFARDGLLALGAEPDVVDECLDSLQRKEIFSVQQDRFAADRGQLRFVQAVVRQVAYSTQSRRDRKRRHLAVADYLTELPDADSDLAIVIAQHLLDAVEASSGSDDDVAELNERACRQLEKAGLRSRELGAMAEAHRLFQGAMERAAAPLDRARLGVEAATAAADAGDFTRGAELAATAVEQYDALALPIEAGSAAGLETQCLALLLDPEGAITAGRTRWDALRQVGGAEAALISLGKGLGMAYNARGEADKAAEVVQERLRCAEALGEPEQVAQAMLALGVYYGQIGFPETSRALTDAAARICREADKHLEVLAHSLNNLAAFHLSRDLEVAEAAAREGLAVARRAGVAGFADYNALNLAIVLWLSGRIKQATELLDDAREWISLPVLQLAVLSLDNRIREAVGQLPTELPEVNDTDVGAIVRADVAMARAMHAGDFEEAAKLAESSLPQLLSSTGIDDDFMWLWPEMVRACVAAGDVARAERVLAPVEDAAKGIVSPAVAAEWRWLRGLVAALRGDDPEQVESDLRRGIVELEAFGARGLRTQAQEDLARWLVEQGRAPEARELVELARATYMEMGADGWLQKLDAWAEANLNMPAAATAR